MLIDIYYELFDYNKYKHENRIEYQSLSYLQVKNHFWEKLNKCHNDNDKVNYFICKNLSDEFIDFKKKI